MGETAYRVVTVSLAYPDQQAKMVQMALMACLALQVPLDRAQ